MKKFTKGILSAFTLTLAFGAIAFTARGIDPASAERPSTVYLHLNSEWKGSSVDHYAAFFFKDGKAVWRNMTKSEGNYYSVAPEDGYSNIIFCAMGNGTDDWPNVIYQTEDLRVTAHGDDCFSLFDCESGGEKSQGIWHKKGEALDVDGGQGNVYDSKYATYYQMLVYAFADGDGDGVGDFKGIIDHLDYLKKLGIGGLWLSPIMMADAYHGYGVTDHYHVNPDYEVTVDAVTYDLTKLVQECHAAGIKIILDLPINHCSYSHPWTWEHPDWFTDDPAFDSLKDFDLDNAAVTNEIKKVGAYWLKEYNVDGYRLDAVKWLFNTGGMASADDAKNIQWLKGFYNYCVQQAGRPVFMTGENYTIDENELIQYHKPIDSSLNFAALGAASWAYEGSSGADFVNWVQFFQDGIRAQNNSAILTCFLSNHDGGRFFNYNPTVNKYLFMSYLNILAPGNSIVYYGDELNLQGGLTLQSGYHGWEDMHYRTPMPFATGRTEMKTYVGWAPIDTYWSTPLCGSTADAHAADMGSFYTAYSHAIRAKNAAPVLYDGNIQSNNISDKRIGSYIARKGTEAATVAFNASNQWISLDVQGGATSILGAASHNGYPVLADNVLEVAPYSAVVLSGAHGLSTHTTPVEPIDPEDAIPEEKAPVALDLYLRGGFNSWGTKEEYRFHTTPNGSAFASVLSDVHITAGQEFKVANASWGTAYGIYDGYADYGDFYYYFEEGTENGNILCRQTGDYDFYVTGDCKIAAFKGQGAAFYGSKIGWTGKGVSAEVLTPWYDYVLRDIELEAGEEIQLWAGYTDGSYRLYCNASEVIYDFAFPATIHDSNVKVTKAGVYSIRVVLSGIDESEGTATYYVIGSDPEAAADAKAFAKSFNAAIEAACKLDGSSDRTMVVNAWNAQATAYSSLSDAAKNVLCKATASDKDEDIAAFTTKYRSIYSLRGTSWSLTNFLGIEITNKARLSTDLITGEGKVAIIVSALALAGVSALVACYLLGKRRKRQ